MAMWWPSAGFGIDTPLISYSVAKSFTNALLAVLVRDGRLKVDQPVGAPEWSSPNDPRASLTIEDLLRMRSGLDAPEDDSASSPVAQMEFLKSDMAAFAAAHPLKYSPGRAYEFTSANTIIPDRLISRTVVRFGYSHPPSFGIADDVALIKAAIAS